jgi:hypothetical protein
MQDRVTKAIITASYDREEDLIAKAKTQYQEEIDAGYYLPTPVFLRGEGQEVTKFNYLLPVGNSWVPMITFPMIGASNSELEKIVVVGDGTTGRIIGPFNDYFGTDVKFGSESEDLKFSETLKKGSAVLEVEKNERFYVLMGDVPLKWRFAGFDDPELVENDLVYDMNSRTRTNSHWPRRFHWKLSYKPKNFRWRFGYTGLRQKVKEAQEFVVNLDAMDEITQDLGLEDHLFDLMYSSRKAHGNRGKSREEKFKEILDQNWGKVSAGAALAPLYSAQLGFYWRKKNKKGKGYLPLSSRGIAWLMRGATGKKILVKCDQDDPAMIEDIDGLADWANISEMMLRRRDSLQPHCSELESFAESEMPGLKQRNDFFYGFPDYMNGLFKQFGIPEPFLANGKFDNPFTSGEMGKPITDRAKDVIKRSLKKHSRYRKRHNS